MTHEGTRQHLGQRCTTFFGPRAAVYYF